MQNKKPGRATLITEDVSLRFEAHTICEYLTKCYRQITDSSLEAAGVQLSFSD